MKLLQHLLLGHSSHWLHILKSKIVYAPNYSVCLQIHPKWVNSTACLISMPLSANPCDITRWWMGLSGLLCTTTLFPLTSHLWVEMGNPGIRSSMSSPLSYYGMLTLSSQDLKGRFILHPYHDDEYCRIELGTRCQRVQVSPSFN